MRTMGNGVPIRETDLHCGRASLKSAAMSDAGIGQLCALLTAMVWASSMVLFKRSGETIPPLALNAFKNVVGLALLV